MNTAENDMNLMANGGFDIGNFDPANIQEEEVICLVIAMDISPSVAPFEAELNGAFQEFIAEMQKSHVAPKLMVKTLEFNESVTHKTGFTPIMLIDTKAFTFKASGNSTALADGAFEALKSAVDYRKQLELTGINCKVLVFVITDGEENSSNKGLGDVKKEIDNLMKEERNVFSFETILFGIGSNDHSFRSSQQAMGFKHLAVVGDSGKEMRKMIGFISASVSKSASNQVVTF